MPIVACDVKRPLPEDPSTTKAASPEHLPPPPESSVSKLDLSFGVVAGICSGVFVKKGAKALAFVFGGIFVLLQYLGSLSLVRVDFARMGGLYKRAFYRVDEHGRERAPTVVSVWRALIDFLTADFQARASFIAGFGLGLRIG